jgi:hypothetical protein
MDKTKVYLVGDVNAADNNRWLAMTNDIEEASRLLEELQGAARMKTIYVEDVSDAGS